MYFDRFAYYDEKNTNWRQLRDYKEKEQKKRFLSGKREELKEQGLTEDEILDQIEALDEVTWTSADWEDWVRGRYGKLVV